MRSLNFGKYAGVPIAQVPEEYLTWLLASSKEQAKAIEEELARRRAIEDADLSWMERVVKAGFRELSKQHHPDLGGNNDDMRELLAAYEALQHKVRQKNGPFKR